MAFAFRVAWDLHQGLHVDCIKSVVGPLALQQMYSMTVDHEYLLWTAFDTGHQSIVHPLVLMPTCVFKLKHIEKLESNGVGMFLYM